MVLISGSRCDIRTHSLTVAADGQRETLKRNDSGGADNCHRGLGDDRAATDPAGGSSQGGRGAVGRTSEVRRPLSSGQMPSFPEPLSLGGTGCERSMALPQSWI